MLEKLKEIFEEHNLVLVDTTKYDSIKNEDLEIPKERVVSYKWLSRKLTKPCKKCKQETISLIQICCNCNYPKDDDGAI